MKTYTQQDIKKNNVIEVTITDMAFGGKGLAKLQLEEGKIVMFVPNTIPGQKVKARVFKKKKSFLMSQGLIGFRTGTPKLKTSKGFTWAAILKLLGVDELGKTYIKTVEQPMKDRLIADREKDTVKLLMKKTGIEVVQDETFYIELKKEEIE